MLIHIQRRLAWCVATIPEYNAFASPRFMCQLTKCPLKSCHIFFDYWSHLLPLTFLSQHLKTGLKHSIFLPMSTHTGALLRRLTPCFGADWIWISGTDPHGSLYLFCDDGFKTCLWTTLIFISTRPTWRNPPSKFITYIKKWIGPLVLSTSRSTSDTPSPTIILPSYLV